MRGTIALVLLALAAAGCGGDAAAPDADLGDAGIGCRDDPRADVYTANMERMGQGGIFRFVLVASDPAPPIKGTNSWTVKILDSAGVPMTGATMTAVPYMPDHGHGTAVVPQVTPDGDGYTVAPLYLFMPGLWQVTLSAQSGAESDTVVYKFCIQG